jgi:hypothetical protein
MSQNGSILPRVDVVTYFLLVYDRSQGKLIEDPRAFGDHADALNARFELEAKGFDPDVEIVVLGGESVESLAATHARYFQRSAEPVG